MNEKININQKGDSNVKDFDLAMADVVRPGKGDWDDFQLMGSSNREEKEYINNGENEQASEALERAHRALGRKILALSQQ